MIRMLAHAYVEDYQRDMRIYNALKAEGIYLDETRNVYTKYVEKIFNEQVGKDFSSALCDFASEGCVRFCDPDREVTDLDELIDIYLK